MGLRTRVFLYIGSVIILLFLAVYALISSSIKSDFLELEQREMEKNIARVTDALNNEVDNLSVKVSDWGQWDDTYQFTQDRNQEFTDSNLQNVSIETLRLNFVVILNNDREVLFKKQIDAAGEPVPFLDSFERYLTAHPFLMEHPDGRSAHKGVFLLPEGALVAVTRAVTTSDGEAPVNGTIVFAYFIDDALVAKLSEITHLKIEHALYQSAATQMRFEDAFKRLSLADPMFVETRPDTDKTINGYALIKDITNEPALFFRVETERDLYQKGLDSLAFFSRMLMVISVVFVLMMFSLFEWLVLRKIVYLKQEVGRVTKEGGDGTQITLSGKDEFTDLAEGINTMLQSLHDADVNRRETEKRFRTVADSAPVMIWMSDTEKKNTYVNKVWLDFTGRSLEEEVGEGWKADIHPDDLKTTDSVYETAFARQQPFSMEYRLRRKDGTYSWVFARAIPHFTADGVFLGYVGSCVDITERKEAEAQKQSQITELEKVNRIMVERELKMIELKKEIKALKSQHALPLV